jgi:hypothetical protein
MVGDQPIRQKPIETDTMNEANILKKFLSAATAAAILALTACTTNPAHMQWMASEIQNARSAIMPNGSHLSQWDDPSNFFPALINFIKDVDDGKKALK